MVLATFLALSLVHAILPWLRELNVIQSVIQANSPISKRTCPRLILRAPEMGMARSGDGSGPSPPRLSLGETTHHRCHFGQPGNSQDRRPLGDGSAAPK